MNGVNWSSAHAACMVFDGNFPWISFAKAGELSYFQTKRNMFGAGPVHLVDLQCIIIRMIINNFRNF